MSTSFRDRALAEAARYGSDSWVFLRELLQNARDAGARRIEIVVSEDGDRESIVCRDDGTGMSYEHARRYLFALYASSKEDDVRQAGQFGVGFWSVLRFQPRTVAIRSRPTKGAGWQVTVDGDLGGAVFANVALKVGTEVVLERRSRRPGLTRKVKKSVAHYGRFLTLRDRPEEPLLVTVNGRSINSDLTLPPPSVTFRRGGCRGVVALAAEPRVELFANGLFVRQAACLEDLLDLTGKRKRRRRTLPLPGSLAPQVLLDSSELELLLARSDVRETRHLERLIRTAERELARVVERQLQVLRPQPWYLPLWAKLREAWGQLGPVWLAGALLVGVLAGWTALAWQGTGVEASAGLPRLGVGGGSEWEAYTDLGALYRGPQLDALAGDSSRVGLSYQPGGAVLFFTALVVEEPTQWADPPPPPLPVGPYLGITCDDTCVDVSLVTAERPGTLRVPVPTGHRLEAGSLRLNGVAQEVQATGAGEPVLLLSDGRGGLLEYRTGPASAHVVPRPPPDDAPHELHEAAARLRDLPIRTRVREALGYAARHIEYDRSAPAVALHQSARAAGRGFLDAALELGKGDCDIQNGLVVALLRLARVEARLAVGWVGVDGGVMPGLHAWVEYFEGGRWRVADASARFTDGSRDEGRFGRRFALPASGTDIALPSLPPPSETSPSPSQPAAEGRARGGIPAALLRELQPSRAWRWPTAVVLLALGAATAAMALRSRGTDSAVRLAAEENLAALLAGALQHPELSRLPALRHGHYVPLLKKRLISLHEAEALAAAGRLYCSSYGSHLAFRAASRGVTVVDAGAAEGQVVCVGLGAIDIDEWSELADRSTVSGLSRRLNQHLAAVGESWRVAEGAGLGSRLRVVDLAALKLGARLVVIDPEHADFTAAWSELAERPETATLLALDVIVTHLELPPSHCARLLATPAVRALAEAAA